MAVRKSKDGMWRYRKMVKLLDGGRTRISGTPSRNTKEAAEHAERMHIDRATNPARPKKEVPRLKKFSDEFMATYVTANNKPSEQATKRYLLDRHILPRLWSLRLDQMASAKSKS